MQFTPGIYKTKNGLKATIYKLSQKGSEWEMVGCIERDNVSFLTGWTLSGKNLYLDQLDLISDQPEAPQEAKQ